MMTSVEEHLRNNQLKILIIMNLPKIHSISKKILVGALGAFLSFFLLFHASANLLILRHDGGEWYNAFCHFMGTYVIVKVMEIGLFTALLLHAVLAIWLAVTNKMARPKGYHKPQRSKTHTGSKIQMWTGILIFACLIMHFTDFYFVKIGWVKGKYMAKTEDVVALKTTRPDTFSYAEQHGEYSAKENWLTNFDKEDKAVLEAAGLEVEPDFYHQAREKFKVLHIIIAYLVFFTVVWFHLRHGFAAVFQTFGLYNYKYGKAIEVLGQIYTWVVCLMFAVVVIGVYFGL
jgi:succinate dehydrogenase / fumarate reductase cytochrome b subunit